MKKHSEYPKELLVPIEGQVYHLGRLTVNWSDSGFMVDIDIVSKETRKIFRSVKRLYNIEDEQEAQDQAMYILSNFLRNGSI